MGLFSDYLEANRAKSPIDPTMHNFEHTKKFNIYTTFQKLESTDNVQEKKLLKESIKLYADQLEQERRKYNYHEKLLRNLLVLKKLESLEISNIIFEYLQEIDEKRDHLNKSLHEIEKKIAYKGKDFSINTAIEKNDLMNLIISAVYFRLKNEKIVENSEFRLIVKDIAYLIEQWAENKPVEKSKKKIVEDYWVKKFELKSSHIRCVNCNNIIYNDLPYCFHCFERN